MTRFIDWHVKRSAGKRVPGAMRDLGKKLLGALGAQLARSNISTGARQVQLPDGSIVRAAFHNGRPIVDYAPVEGGVEWTKLCSLQMDSGILDLGTNTQADITLSPTFADVAPTLYPGDSAKVNGVAAGRTLSLWGTPDGMQVIGEAGSSEPGESTALEGATQGGLTVTRAEKRTAQAVYPASLWTGLAHRFVQALYGTETAAYRAKPSGAAGIDISYATGGATYRVSQAFATGDTGIVDPEGTYDYWLAQATPTSITFTPMEATTTCGKMLHKAFQTGGIARAHRRRLEAYLLADLRPSATGATTVTFATPVTGNPFAYGWKFNERGSELAVVTYASGSARLWRRQLSINSSGAFVVTEADEAAVTLGQKSNILYPGELVTATAGARTHGSASFPSGSIDGASWDAPVYCYYIKGAADSGLDTLEVVRSFYSHGGTVDTPSEGGCGSLNNPNVSPCLAPSATDALCNHDSGERTANIAMGYYTTRYSSVRVVEMDINPGSGPSASGNNNLARTLFGVTWETIADPDNPITSFVTFGTDGSGAEGCVTNGGFWAASYGDPPPAANKILALEADVALADPECDCPQATDNDGAARPCLAMSYTCPPLGGDWVFQTLTFRVDAEVNLQSTTVATADGYRFTQSRDRAMPTVLLIPAGSATGCYLRERDVDVNFVSATRNRFTSAEHGVGISSEGESEVAYTITGTARCNYFSPTFGSQDVDSSLGNLAEGYEPYYRRYVQWPIDGVGEDTSGSLRSGVEAARGTFLGADGAAVALTGASGTVYSPSSPEVVTGAPQPTCGSIDITTLASVEARLIQYGLKVTGSGFTYLDDASGTAAIQGRGPLLCLLGSAFGYARFNDLATMRLTHPVMPLDYSSGYAGASIQYPSFVGYA